MSAQGRHFLHIPGPSPIPDRILRAIGMPIIDHRSAEFARLGKEVLEGCKTIFKTSRPVVIYPSSGTGAWEAAIVNTLSPGDTVLMAETGHFATLWKQIADRFGIKVDFIPGDWRRGADPAAIEARLAEDRGSVLAFEAAIAFSEMALKLRPGGSISPFCEPETVTSTPHSSWR